MNTRLLRICTIKCNKFGRILSGGIGVVWTMLQKNRMHEEQYLCWKPVNQKMPKIYTRLGTEYVWSLTSTWLCQRSCHDNLCGKSTNSICFSAYSGKYKNYLPNHVNCQVLDTYSFQKYCNFVTNRNFLSYDYWILVVFCNNLDVRNAIKVNSDRTYNQYKYNDGCNKPTNYVLNMKVAQLYIFSIQNGDNSLLSLMRCSLCVPWKPTWINIYILSCMLLVHISKKILIFFNNNLSTRVTLQQPPSVMPYLFYFEIYQLRIFASRLMNIF